MIDEIEVRLRNLSQSVVLHPDDERAISAIRPFERPTTRVGRKHLAVRVSVAAAASVIAVLLVNVAAAYFAPKYERTLADSGVGPVSQRFLAAVGLSDGDVTTIGDSATSSGHTLKLEAAYADGLRTVVFVSIDGRGVTGNPKQYGLQPGDWGIDYNNMTLTDQFGHTYGGYGIGGPTELQFEALPWPASQLGARLTLHITGIEALWKIASQGPSKVIDTEALTTHGDWTLHATLISAPAHTIGRPAPIHTSIADYTFTSITASETELVLHWTVAGPVNEQLSVWQLTLPNRQTDPYADPLIRDYFTPHVYDASGTQLQMQDWGFGSSKTGPAQGEMTVFIPGPGRYRIKLGAAVDDRWVVVP